MRLIATSAFRHHGRTLAVGEAFTASPVEALAYTYQHIATYDTPNKALTAVPEAAPTPRRRYRRRDLTAESS